MKKVKKGVWHSVKVPAPPSDALNIHRLLVWRAGGWHVGWFRGGLLQDWVIDGSSSSWDDIEYWMEIPAPKKPRVR